MKYNYFTYYRLTINFSLISKCIQQNTKRCFTYFHAGSFCKHRVFQTLKVHLNVDKLILYAELNQI